jgi:hypothetical protein
MFDNMTWEVAAAGREERLARAQRNTLLSAAAAARSGHGRRQVWVSRERMALGLVALAARLAPTVTTARIGTGVLAR